MPINRRSHRDYHEKDSIPSNWKLCPSIGKIINDIFIPFKTPIDSISRIKSSTDSFNLDNLFEMEKCRRIKAIIKLNPTKNLYETEKYRPSVDFVDINNVSLFDPPQFKSIDFFISKVDYYVKKNDKNLVGVHCDLGHNLTGFMIVCYLYEKCDIHLPDAIWLFSHSRPPGILAQSFIDELYHRYDYRGLPLSVQNPDWLSSTVKRSGLSSESLPSGVRLVTDTDEIEAVINSVKGLNKSDHDGFDGLQPSILRHCDLQTINTQDCGMSLNPVGTRLLMYIKDESTVFLIDNRNFVFRVSALRFPHNYGMLLDTIVDGDMVKMNLNGVESFFFIAKDMLVYGSFSTRHFNFAQRKSMLSHIFDDKRFINEPEVCAKPSRIVKGDFQLISINHFPVKHVLDTWGNRYKLNNSLYQVDGLFFQPFFHDSVYTFGLSKHFFLWKPSETSFVDFRLSIFSENDEIVGNLYVGGQSSPFGVLTNTSAILARGFDRKIVECTFVKAVKKWNLERIKIHRTEPHYVTVANEIYQNILNPVTIQDIENATKS